MKLVKTRNFYCLFYLLHTHTRLTTPNNTRRVKEPLLTFNSMLMRCSLAVGHERKRFFLRLRTHRELIKSWNIFFPLNQQACGFLFLFSFVYISLKISFGMARSHNKKGGGEGGRKEYFPPWKVMCVDIFDVTLRFS